MPTLVTTHTVRDSTGQLRELHVSTTSSDANQPERVTYSLDGSAVEKQDGHYVLTATGEILNEPDAESN